MPHVDHHEVVHDRASERVGEVGAEQGHPARRELLGSAPRTGRRGPRRSRAPRGLPTLASPSTRSTSGALCRAKRGSRRRSSALRESGIIASQSSPSPKCTSSPVSRGTPSARSVPRIEWRVRGQPSRAPPPPGPAPRCRSRPRWPRRASFAAPARAQWGAVAIRQPLGDLYEELGVAASRRRTRSRPRTGPGPRSSTPTPAPPMATAASASSAARRRLPGALGSRRAGALRPGRGSPGPVTVRPTRRLTVACACASPAAPASHRHPAEAGRASACAGRAVGLVGAPA